MNTFLIAKDDDIVQVIDTRTNKARYFIVDKFIRFYTSYVKGEYLHFSLNEVDVNVSSVIEELQIGTIAFDELKDKFPLEKLSMIYKITVDETYLIFADRFEVGLIGDPLTKIHTDFSKRFSDDYSSGKLSSSKVINVIIDKLIETNEK